MEIDVGTLTDKDGPDREKVYKKIRQMVEMLRYCQGKIYTEDVSGQYYMWKISSGQKYTLIVF